MNIAQEFTGYDRDRADAETARIEDTTARVLEWARHDGVTPTDAARGWRAAASRRRAPTSTVSPGAGGPVIRRPGRTAAR